MQPFGFSQETPFVNRSIQRSAGFISTAKDKFHSKLIKNDELVYEEPDSPPPPEEEVMMENLENESVFNNKRMRGENDTIIKTSEINDLVFLNNNNNNSNNQQQQQQEGEEVDYNEDTDEDENLPTFKFTPAEFAPLEETLPNRLNNRQRQIEIGKSTLGYYKYTKRIPKEKRGPNLQAHPRTPDIKLLISKRSFEGRVKAWRRMLHNWDWLDAEEDDANLIAPTFIFPKSEKPNDKKKPNAENEKNEESKKEEEQTKNELKLSFEDLEEDF